MPERHLKRRLQRRLGSPKSTSAPGTVILILRVKGNSFCRNSLVGISFFKVNNGNTHCVKIVRIRSFSGPHFSAFWLNTVQMRENTEQKNSEYRHFLCSDQNNVGNKIANYNYITKFSRPTANTR